MMLDPSIVAQLGQVFAPLSSSFTLVASGSEEPAYGDLVTLVTELASASPKLAVKLDDVSRDGVLLRLERDGALLPMSFRGVPGGHELSSLVLAILHADGRGKRPDDGILARVRALAGSPVVRTYVSLSCENCPDVVQALGLMALTHESFTHEMVDGALFPEEVAKLGIQGVPAVFVGDKLVHSGKASFAELLVTLERELGSQPREATGPRELSYDVVVIGGGPAGASAAIYTARKGLKTAIVTENLGGQLKETLGIENMIGQKRTEGARLAADLEAHVAVYGIDVLEHRKVSRVVNGPTKTLEIQGGERVSAPILIVATGAKWRELGVTGEKEYLGRGVAFCPHCDGPFYAKKKIAVVGGGNSGVEATIDLAAIASHVTLLEYADSLKADDVLQKKLRSLPNVDVIVSAKTLEVVGDGAKVNALRYEDRASGEAKTLTLDGVFVQIGLLPNSAIVRDVVATNRFGEIVVDEKGRTDAAGIYAAGDVTNVPYKQIVIAMGEGAKVALAAFEDRMKAA